MGKPAIMHCAQCGQETPLSKAGNRHAEITTLREQLRVARRLLWIRHGCPIAALYGDDDEMQCRNCGIDFKRTEPSEIDRMFKQAGLARIDAMKEKPNA